MKINTNKIKYLIAREGLIILGFIGCIAICMGIHSIKRAKISKYMSSAQEYEYNIYRGNIFDQFDTPSSGNPFGKPAPSSMGAFDQLIIKQKSISSGVKVTFPKNVDYEGLVVKTLIKEYPDKNNGWWIPCDMDDTAQHRYDAQGNRLFEGMFWNFDFNNTAPLFLFMGYPAYLLVRFIVWAIGTVRHKNLLT